MGATSMFFLGPFWGLPVCRKNETKVLHLPKPRGRAGGRTDGRTDGWTDAGRRMVTQADAWARTAVAVARRGCGRSVPQSINYI